MTLFLIDGRRAAATATATTLIASTAGAAESPWTVLPSADVGVTTDNALRGVPMVDTAHGFAVGVADRRPRPRAGTAPAGT